MQIAWATGLFEGEGYIYLHNKYQSVRLGMTQTDLDVLERLQSVFGGNISPRITREKHHKQAWEWRLGRKQDVIAAIKQMLPLLGERRACKALDALDHLDGV